MATTESRSSPFRLFKSSKKVDKIKDASPEKVTKKLKDSVVSKKKSVSEKSKTLPHGKKSSVLKDAHYNTMPADYDDDPESLIESLQLLGDEQPKVARSIPKNSKPSSHADNSLKDCLYTQDVYDGMLSDSLRVCDMLQSHLEECMVTVRSRSPEGSKTGSVENHSDADSGRGASSPASPPPIPGRGRLPMKSCIKHDV